MTQAGPTLGDAASPFKYDRFEDCPDARKHTKQPAGYIDRSLWADRKAKTHDCFQCPTCGFWRVWKRKERGMTPS